MWSPHPTRREFTVTPSHSSPNVELRVSRTIRFRGGKRECFWASSPGRRCWQRRVRSIWSCGQRVTGPSLRWVRSS